MKPDPIDTKPQNSYSPDPSTPSSPPSSQDVRTWAMLLHLSVFAGALIPFAGLVAPIVIWQVQKDKMPELDAHGKIVANALLSFVIYSIVGVILTFVLIGIPLLIAIGIIAIAFPIIGGLKAYNGEVWRYPLTIAFFK